MLLGEPDLAGGRLSRGSLVAPSANATHAAWMVLMEGQHGWDEIPDHAPSTKELCSSPPRGQKRLSYAEAAGVEMCPGLHPGLHSVYAWSPLSRQLLRKLWGTVLGVTLGMSTATGHQAGLWWHLMAHVPCHGFPVFQGLPWHIRSPGWTQMSHSCHSVPQTVSVYSTHPGWLSSVG